MPTALEQTLQHLARLVACDSRNPPRSISADGSLFGYLGQQLQGFDNIHLTHKSRNAGNGLAGKRHDAHLGRSNILINSLTQDFHLAEVFSSWIQFNID